MPARTNTEERRAQIVDGLLSVMASAGYEGATVVAIGKAAGLASGLVHYHFATKDDVLLALVERLVAGVMARYEARVTPTSGAQACLHAWIDAHVALGKDGDPRAVVAWSLVGAEAVRNVAVKAAYQRAIEQEIAFTKELVKAALDAQGKGTAQAKRIAATVVSAMEGALRIGAVTEGVLPGGFAATMIKRLVDGLIDGEPAR